MANINQMLSIESPKPLRLCTGQKAIWQQATSHCSLNFVDSILLNLHRHAHYPSPTCGILKHWCFQARLCLLVLPPTPHDRGAQGQNVSVLAYSTLPNKCQGSSSSHKLRRRIGMVIEFGLCKTDWVCSREILQVKRNIHLHFRAFDHPPYLQRERQLLRLP